MKLNRRDFLRGLGATAAALLLPRGLGDRAEAERLVTPDHGGLLVLPEQRVALIDEFELSTPVWAGTDVGTGRVYGAIFGRPVIASKCATMGEQDDIILADWREVFADLPSLRPPWYVDSTNPAARDLPGYGLTLKAPMATIGYAIKTRGTGEGDVFYVLCGHNEGTNGESMLELRPGTTIVGVGKDSQRPSIHVTFTESREATTTAGRGGQSASPVHRRL